MTADAAIERVPGPATETNLVAVMGDQPWY